MSTEDTYTSILLIHTDPGEISNFVFLWFLIFIEKNK